MRQVMLWTALCTMGCPTQPPQVAVPAPVPVATQVADAGAPLLGNATCPVSGEPVAGTPSNPTFRSTFQGVTLGFMCPMHLAEFDNGTDAQKVAWLAKARSTVEKR